MMMPDNTAKTNGFTTVELLVTLFIAFTFIATAYQLYVFVIRDSANTRDRTVASNIAANQLAREAAEADSCSSTPVTTTVPTPPDTGLPQPVTITSTVSWPYGCTADKPIKRVEVTVTYGGSGQEREVHHARFVQS